MRPRLRLLFALTLAAPAPVAAQGASYEQLQTFSSLLNQIRLNYVDSVSYTVLVQAAIDGVLASLDPHSRFVRRDQAEREAAYEAGVLAGTGVILDEADGALVVLSVLPKSPAARSGIAAGDRLLAINDTASAGLTASDAMEKLIGEKGKRVRLLLARGSRLEPDTVKAGLKFDFIEPRSVSIVRMVDGTTGYIRLSGFHARAGEEVERALKDLRGKGMKRLLLDLRGNPGGLMVAPVEIATNFFPKRTLVFRTSGRHRSANGEFHTEKDGDFRDLPIILLQDGGSASASEALAGTLQDHDRAVLLGRRSFGKALIQAGLPIPPQGDAVWLTIGRVVTPSGRIIQRAYRGLKYQQYRSFGGVSGAEQDTSQVFLTDRRRHVRGGGGIVPDVEVPRSAELPGWWGTVADSGWIEAVADSVAAGLPRDQGQAAAWLVGGEPWRAGMVAPLLARVHGRLQVTAEPDSAQAGRIGRIMAYRAAEVRWGPEAADALLLRHDPDVRAAMATWDRLPALLAGP